MKITYLKHVDTLDDFYGFTLVAENPKEKQLIKRMAKASFVFKTKESQSASLIKNQAVVTIEIVNVM
jgi:hypothetical protein